METTTISRPTSFLTQKFAFGITPAHILLVFIILLSIGLHFSNLDAIGDANTYYTAAVESMLKSWNNFFFVAAEPGGSVSVDKPPLGLWIEAAFAFVFGVSGTTVSLPNMLAGVLSVPLLYYLVKKYMGELAGLVAALVLVITPVAIATDRNNTMDGILVFTLLLAAWAFVAATENGKTRWLLLGAFIVGLGFNIKMLQAFLPLPAFYALYFLGAKTGWWRKIFNLGIATILLLVVSFSWAIVVDLTPANLRPYVGSSDDNTVMELIIGHNGLSRLFNPRASNNAPQQDKAASDQTLANANPVGQNAQPELQGFQPRPGGPPNGQPPASLRPRLNPPPGALGDGPNTSPNFNPNNNPQNAGSTPFSQETGSPGITRFFVWPLSKQMSWLLPFALISLVVVVFATQIRLPLEYEHKAFILWGGWLVTCLVFFSAVEGIFHAYYTIMLAPALGAVVGIGIAQLWRWQFNRLWANALFIIATALTIGFQIYSASQYGFLVIAVYLPLLALLIGLGLYFFKSLRKPAFLLVMVSMMILPLIWTGMTVLDKAPNTSLPTSIDAESARNPNNAQDRSRPAPELNERNTANTELIAYLQSNTQDTEYLVAVPNAHTGSPLVLATGRPVLYMGGFGGSDPVIDATGLAEMVKNGKLRYVLFGSKNNKQDIAKWLTSSCKVVPQFSQNQANIKQQNQPGAGGPQGPGNEVNTLYQCG